MGEGQSRIAIHRGGGEGIQRRVVAAGPIRPGAALAMRSAHCADAPSQAPFSSPPRDSERVNQRFASDTALSRSLHRQAYIRCQPKASRKRADKRRASRQT